MLQQRQCQQAGRDDQRRAEQCESQGIEANVPADGLGCLGLSFACHWDAEYTSRAKSIERFVWPQVTLM